jgi:hypothetical protein
MKTKLITSIALLILGFVGIFGEYYLWIGSELSQLICLIVSFIMIIVGGWLLFCFLVDFYNLEKQNSDIIFRLKKDLEAERIKYSRCKYRLTEQEKKMLGLIDEKLKLKAELINYKNDFWPNYDDLEKRFFDLKKEYKTVKQKLFSLQGNYAKLKKRYEKLKLNRH